MSARSIPVRPAKRRASWLALALSLACFPAFGADDPPPTTEELQLSPMESLRGFLPNQPFLTADGIEAINTSNGNLMLTVPLGQEYRVGPILSYQLTATYNSDNWNHVVLKCPRSQNCGTYDPVTFAVPNPQSNAGLGWEVHFGKLYEPAPPPNAEWYEKDAWPNPEDGFADGLTRWLYVSPNGGSHQLHRLAGRPGISTSANARYSKDGTFLRMVQTDAFTAEVQHPDGRISVFEKTTSPLGTLFCGRNGNTCWRFREMKDAHGNFFRVEYGIDQAGTLETWTITDSTGRSHQIVFGLDDQSRAAGDGDDYGDQWPDVDGNELGDLARVVKEVRVASFDYDQGGPADPKAVYRFRYTNRRISRGCPNNTSGSDNGGPGFGRENDKITVPILDRIEFPEGQGFEFESDLSNFYGCSKQSGKVVAVTSPTRGRTVYGYGNWSFPTRCSFVALPPTPNPEPYRTQRFGILRKVVMSLQPNGSYTEAGRWEYRNFLVGAPQDSGPNCRRYDHRRVEVKGPVVDGGFRRDVFYTNVYEGPYSPTPNTRIGEQQVTDNGLPYRKDDPSQDGRIGDRNGNYRFLSQETLSCINGGSCTGMRSKYVRYEMEFRTDCSGTRHGGEPASCYALNPVLAAERTVFHDDGGKYIEKHSLELDGLGNPRVTSVRDDFDGVNRRIKATTSYTVSNKIFTADPETGYFVMHSPPNTYYPGTFAKWILSKYNKKSVTEIYGGTEGPPSVTESQFNAEGRLTCTRTWKFPGGRSAKDLVHERRLDGRGLMTREVFAGGDTADLDPGTLCATTGSAGDGSAFEVVHEYDPQALVLGSSRIPGYPYSYRASIDRNTGLPWRIFDVTDRYARLLFDPMGRVVSVRPEAGLQQAWTNVTYNNLPGRPPDLLIEQTEPSPNGSTLNKARRFVDDRGRVIREVGLYPTGLHTSAESETVSTYDVLGNLRTTTTVKTGPTAPGITRYLDYDVFGRPARIVRPDSTWEELDYRGVRVTESTTNIRTSESGNTAVTTTKVLDAQGRERRLSNPVYVLELDYDVNGQVIERTRTEQPATSSSPTQTRRYGWDNRGFLVSEQLPELGTGGSNGTVTYVRDALGKVRTRSDGRGSILYRYDTGGRLVRSLKDLGGTSRVLSEWEWGTGTSPGDLSLGKLKRAKRHNHPTGIEDFLVVETYTYGGKLGNVSEKLVQLQFPDRAPGDPTRFGPTFRTGFEYDLLGSRTALDYPSCVTTPETGQSYCNDPLDVQAPPHRVSNTFAAATLTRVVSDQGASAVYGYHPNLQISRADYGNTSFTTFERGDGGLARARRIRAHQGNFQDPNGPHPVLFDTGVISYDGAGSPWAIGGDRYTYDLAGRLKSATVNRLGPGHREDYAYDAFDNLVMVQRDGGTTFHFNVDGNNRFRGFGSQVDASYDGAGNLIQRSAGQSPPQQYVEYDDLDMQMLYRFTDSANSHEYRYIYGPGNYRLFTFDGQTGQRTWKLRDLDGKPLRQFIVNNGWGPYQSDSVPGEHWRFDRDFLYGSEGMFATVGLGAVHHYFHRDHLGSTRLITGHFGARVYEAAFYPYGDEVKVHGAGPGEIASKFTGHERDEHGRSDYMKGRYYHLAFKRFTSVDPARDGWNLYGYGAANPLTFVDPSGLATFKISVSGDLAVFTGIKGEAGIVFDDKGNVGFFETIGGGVGFIAEAGGNVGIGSFETITDMRGAAVDYDAALFGASGGFEFTDPDDLAESLLAPVSDFAVDIGAGPGIGSGMFYTRTAVQPIGNVIIPELTDFLANLICGCEQEIEE